MNSFYPEGMTDINMNKARENGEIVTPPEESFNTEAMRGSMQQILSDNLGQFVICEFLIGTQAMTRKQGILYSVGRSYVVLYEELQQNFVVCDIFSIKFVTFYLPGQRPPSNGSPSGSGAGNGMGGGNGMAVMNPRSGGPNRG